MTDVVADAGIEDGADVRSTPLVLRRALARTAAGTDALAGLCIGDVDDDGHTEVVMPMYQEPAIVLDAALMPLGRIVFDRPGRHCMIADLDGDRHSELVFATSDFPRTTSRPGSIYIGHFANGTWTEQWRSPMTAYFSTAVVPLTHLDLDRDGFPELVAASAPPNARILSFQADSTAPGGFAPVADIPYGSINPISLEAGDVDGDDLPELVAGLSCEGSFHVYGRDYLNAGEVMGFGATRAIVADFDGDGSSEVLLGTTTDCSGNQPSPSLRLFRREAVTNAFVEVTRRPFDSQLDQHVLLTAVDFDRATAGVDVFYCTDPVRSSGIACGLVALDHGELVERWAWSSSTGAFLTAVVANDVDRDGEPEVYVATSRELLVFAPPRQ